MPRASPLPAAAFILLLLAPALAGCLAPGGKEGVLRLGYFATVPHAPAVVGVASGHFAAAMAPTALDVQVLQAGPAAFEALLSGQLDVVLAGPTPTAAAMAATGPGVLVVVAGVASGGAGLVVQPHLADVAPAELAGRTLATPQLGNTQDVALKGWLAAHGVASRDRGGKVQVINVPNPDIYLLFREGRIDGAWVPEPWMTRLVRETGAVVRVQEADLWPEGAFVTAHLVTTRAFLEARPDDVGRLLSALVETILDLRADADAHLRFNSALRNMTGKALHDDTARGAFQNVRFTWDPLAHTFMKEATISRELGYLRRDLPPGSDMHDLRLLNQVLAARNLSGVAG